MVGGKLWPGHGGQAGPLQGRPQVLLWLPPRFWAHLPTVVPCPSGLPSHGEQDEKAKPIHGCQRHVSAASTEGSVQQHSHSCNARSSQSILSPGADVMEDSVPCSGHRGGLCHGAHGGEQ